MSTTTTQTGIICRVNEDKGFCFLKVSDSAKTIFAHVSDFVDYNAQFDDSLINRRVDFIVRETEKGPRAVHAKVLD